MSKEDGHTPNEWYAVRHEHTLPESRKDCYRIEIRGNPVKVNGKTVASEPICTLHAGFIHFEGNAALILISPLLLALCEEAAADYELTAKALRPHNPDGAEVYERMAKRYRAAIAKAKAAA